MSLKDELVGRCELLFVSPENLSDVVARIAPGKILVDRETFIGLAVAMLDVVEKAAR